MPAGNVTLTANFATVATSYTLTISSNGCGSTVPAGGAISHSAGDAISVSASPCDGSHRFSGWSITGASCGGGASASPCAFSMPAGNVTLAANFVSGSSGCTAVGAINAALAQPVSCSLAGGVLTLSWSGGGGPNYVFVGSSPGTHSYGYQGPMSGTAASFSGLPSSGTVYIRLWTDVGGYYYNDYTIAAGTSGGGGGTT